MAPRGGPRRARMAVVVLLHFRSADRCLVCGAGESPGQHLLELTTATLLDAAATFLEASLMVPPPHLVNSPE